MNRLFIFIGLMFLSINVQGQKLSKAERAAKSVEIIDGKMIGVTPWKDGGPYYTEVIEADGTKDELYVRARTWFAEAFRDSKNVIQMDDKDAGVIIAKGTHEFVHDAWVLFTLKVQVKDGRFKYDLYGFDQEVFAYAPGVGKKMYKYTAYEMFYDKKGVKNEKYGLSLNLVAKRIVSPLIDAVSLKNVEDDSDW